MIDDYNKYKYTGKEFLKYLFMGSMIGGLIGYLFYSSVISVGLFMLYGLLYVKNKKTELIERRKWILNQEFRDGLSSISAALGAGYSIENAFTEAVNDLGLMYSPNSLIIKEFKGMVQKIYMNITLEDILKDFSNRTNIEDISNFTEVFITAKRTGGDLIKIIKTTCNTISDKIEVKREILTLVSAKKFEANIMSLIPLGIILYLRVCSPDFLTPLYHNLLGIIFMTIILIAYYFSYLLMKHLMDIRI